MSSSALVITAIALAAAAGNSIAQPREAWSGSYQCSAMKSEVASSPAFTSSVRMTVEGSAANIVKESGETKQTLNGEIRGDTLKLEGVGMRKDTSSPAGSKATATRRAAGCSRPISRRSSGTAR
jgi:hypothetical protein